MECVTTLRNKLYHMDQQKSNELFDKSIIYIEDDVDNNENKTEEKTEKWKEMK